MSRCISLLALCFFMLSGITSNNIASFPIKTVVFFLLCLALFYGVVTKTYRIGFHEVEVLYCMLIFLFVWGMIGFLNGYTTSLFQQAIKVITCVFSWVIFYIIYNNNIIKIQDMVKIISIGFWTGIVVKFFFEFLYIIGYMPLEDIVVLYKDVFSLEVMPLQIADGALGRIGTITDVFVLSVFPFLVYVSRSKKEKILIIVCTFLFTLINFSRAYIAQTIIFMLIMILPTNLHSVKYKWLVNTFAILLFSGLAFLFFGNTILDTSGVAAIENRFIGADADASDLQRVVQFDVLSDEIKYNILLGNGLGAYVHNYIRNDAMPFLYEMEYLSLIYQFGIIGMFYILGMFVLMIRKIRITNLSMQIRILVYFNLICFFMRPFTNPMLFASSSILVLISVFIFCEYFSLKNATH
nr:hypothetical protein [Mitsuokella multacida]